MSSSTTPTHAERKSKVHVFIDAYRSKKAIVSSFKALSSFLEMSPIKLVPPYDEVFMRSQDVDDSPLIIPTRGLEPIAEEDAKAYFDYLMGIVSGTLTVSRNPEASETWIIEATDQLYQMILGMTPDIEYRGDIYNMPDWLEKLKNMEERLKSIQEVIDSRDSKIIDVLTIVRKWLETYNGVLDDAREYFQNRAGGVKKNAG